MSQKKQVAREKKAKRSKYDSAWKEIIEKLFEDFLEFFFPVMHQVIDFTKKFEFLDKEMRPITAFSNLGDRVSDVVVKVHLKDGTYRYICIFIHIEIQGQPRANFMEQMYIYNYRTFDKRIEGGVPVISVAILTDDDENYRPDEYCVSFCGFELRMRIPIVKIIDYKLKKELREKLETSTNPMAMVVKAQLKSFEVKKADEDTKFDVTKELIRQCYKHGYSRDEINTLAKFIEWIIRLSKASEKRLKEEIKRIEEEFKMPYLASWERSAKREGKREGVSEEKIRIARELFKMGIDIDKIAAATELDRDRIEKLASNSN